MRAALAAGLAALVGAGPMAAQSLRALAVERQHHGETRLAATVRFAAGELLLVPATPGTLYDLSLVYDTERYQPRTSYDPATGRLELGVARAGSGGLRVSSIGHLAQRATVALSGAVDLDLRVELDAAEGRVELGGLRLGTLDFTAGASRSTVRWSRANPGTCSEATLRAGAAELVLEGLGYSNCRAITVQGGVGTLVLDLGGPWRTQSRLDVSVTMGGVRLRLPRGLGVRLTLDRFAASFQPDGFVRQGEVYETPGYAAADRKVEIALSARVGGTEVVWVGAGD